MDFDDLDDLESDLRTYDIVIHGATGFTGCLIAEHLDGVLLSKGGIWRKWAVAGRNLEKLQKVASKCKTSPGVIKAETLEELSEMASQTKVVIAAAGPYALCGDPVVKACIENNTHYLDVTGEVSFIARICKKYHQAARDKGVMIVTCAGVMSALDDLSLYLLVQKIGPLKEFRTYDMSYGFQLGGTFYTGLTSLRCIDKWVPSTLDVFCDPFSLGGVRQAGVREADADCVAAEQDTRYPSIWLMPSHMSHTSSRVLRRTCELFENVPSDGISYGKDIVISARGCTFDKSTAEFAAKTSPVPRDFKDVDRQTKTMDDARSNGKVPKQGEGPSKALRSLGFTSNYAIAESESGVCGEVLITGPDPLEVTAMSAVAGALVLVEEVEAIRSTDRGGVVTPAFAFHGSSYSSQICAHRYACAEEGQMLKFEVEECALSEDKLKGILFASLSGIDAGRQTIAQKKLKMWEPPEFLR